MNEIEVRELESSEYKEWDLLVEEAQPGTLFHTSQWLEICRDVLSRDVKIYGCFRNDELVGGCPIFVKNLKSILKIGTSTCNMTDYCGPLIKEVASSKVSKRMQETQNILNVLREFLCEQGFDSIHLKFSPGLDNVRPFIWNGWNSKVHYTYYLDLKENIDNKISRTIRKDLKSANEAGFKTRVWNNLKTYYGLLSMVYEKQNMEPPLPKEFFERVFNLIQEKDIGYMLVCETPDEEIVAAHLTLYGKKSTINWSTARNPFLSLRGSNALLYYNEFRNLQSRNFEYMNVMSANIPKFAEFIGGFSPKLIPYYSVTQQSKKYSIFKNLYEIATEPLKNLC
jgi:Acetyltransferase (GNAT) domain